MQEGGISFPGALAGSQFCQRDGVGRGEESGLDMGIAIRAHVGRVGPGC